MEITELARPPQEKKEANKERLSNDEIGQLISAFGNHEAKALTLIAMKPNNIYSTWDLHQAVMQIQGQPKGWAMHKNGPFSYCEDSLSPIGLVTKEVLNEGGLITYGYIKTEYGERVGVPLAGLLLKFSLEHSEFSLQDFFAITSSSSAKPIISEQGLEIKKRAPVTRLKVFWELTTAELPVNEVDLAKWLGENSSGVIGKHLRSLAENGLITYTSTKPGEAVSFYQLAAEHPVGQPLQYKSRPSLTQFVYQAFLKYPDKQWTSDTLTNYYLGLSAEERKQQTSGANFKKLLTSVTSHLIKAGYVHRGQFSSHYKSEVTLTDIQRKALVDLVNIIDKFQNQDSATWQEGKEFAYKLLNHPEVVSKIFAKAKEHSFYANATSSEETKQRITAIVSSSEIPLTNQQIRERLLSDYQQHLSSDKVRILTSSLAGDGIISSWKEKGQKKYQINLQYQ